MKLTPLLFLLLCPVAGVRGEEIPGLIYPIKQASVASPVFKDVVMKVLVREGDEVQMDQPLVQLKNEREVLEVELAEKLLQTAEFTARGAEALYKEKIASEANWRIKQAEYEQTKTQLDVARLKLREKIVRSPLAGIVVKKHKEDGEAVDQAEKLMDIVAIDQVEVQVYLDPKFLTKVKLDQPVSISVPVVGNARFQGKISFIDPRIDAASGLVRVKIIVENQDRVLKAGMRAIATL